MYHSPSIYTCVYGWDLFFACCLEGGRVFHVQAKRIVLQMKRFFIEY